MRLTTSSLAHPSSSWETSRHNARRNGHGRSDYCIIDHCSTSWTNDEAFSSRCAKNTAVISVRSCVPAAIFAGGRTATAGASSGTASASNSVRPRSIHASNSETGKATRFTERRLEDDHDLCRTQKQLSHHIKKERRDERAAERSQRASVPASSRRRASHSDVDNRLAHAYSRTEKPPTAFCDNISRRRPNSEFSHRALEYLSPARFEQLVHHPE